MANGIQHETESLLGILYGEAYRLNSKTLRRTIDDIKGILHSFLALAKPEKIKREKVYLQPIFQDIKGKAVEINPQVKFLIPQNNDLQVLFEPILLTRVMWIVVDNAIRYTAEKENKAEIEISARRVQDKVEVKIKDNGPGISEQMAREAFSFFKSSSSKKGKQIGLCTVHQIMTTLGGRITIEPHTDRGTQVIMEFPV